MKTSFMEDEANKQETILNQIIHGGVEGRGNKHTGRMRYNFSPNQLEKPIIKALASTGENMEQVLLLGMLLCIYISERSLAKFLI